MRVLDCVGHLFHPESCAQHACSGVQNHEKNHTLYFRMLAIATWTAQNRARQLSELLDKTLEMSKSKAERKRRFWPGIALCMTLIFSGSQILFTLQAQFAFVSSPDCILRFKEYLYLRLK